MWFCYYLDIMLITSIIKFIQLFFGESMDTWWALLMHPFHFFANKNTEMIGHHQLSVQVPEGFA